MALLAGVSVEYYVRLERGNLGGVSDGVLQALANALQLDEAERAHLYDLARTSAAPLRASRPVHEVRLTAEDQAIEERAFSFASVPVVAVHLLPPS